MPTLYSLLAIRTDFNSTRPQFPSVHQSMSHNRPRNIGWFIVMILFWASQTAQAQQCPTITNTSVTAITACSGQPVSGLAVNTTATFPAYHIEFARFATLQADPYVGTDPVTVGEVDPVNGLAALPVGLFPPNTGTTDVIYYVYACLKLPPADPTCHPTALIIVTVKPKPTAHATGGIITCANQSTFHLTGSSTVANSTYAWAGPGISPVNQSQQNPVVAAAGTYTLVTTANGCVSEPSTATVTESKTPPVASVNSLTLSCARLTGVLTATATNATSLSYAWSTGANTASISVTSGGPYSVTVTNENGCTAVAGTTVANATTAPSVSAIGGTLTCSNGSVTLVSTVLPVGDYEYLWTGPGSYSSSQAQPIVGMAGTYTLTVTNANGCSAITTAEVVKDNSLPGASAVGGTITCAQTTVQLKGSTTSNAAVIYIWSGPGITSATETQQNPTVSVPGNYSLLVTRIGSSCVSMAETSVDVNTGKPGLTVNTSPACTGQTLTLTGSSTVVNATYAWTGPAAFSASTAVATIAAATTANAGSYSLVVTNLETGCQSSTAVAVVLNVGPPNFSLTAREATCTGSVSKSDGEIRMAGFAAGDTYEVSTTGTFTGTGLTIPADGILVKNLSRTGTAQVYRVRVYNATGCFVENMVSLINKTCECATTICVPITIVRTKVARVK